MKQDFVSAKQEKKEGVEVKRRTWFRRKVKVSVFYEAVKINVAFLENMEEGK